MASFVFELDKDVGPCEWGELCSHGHSTIWLMAMETKARLPCGSIITINMGAIDFRGIG
jgi:hypothetical protein